MALSNVGPGAVPPTPPRATPSSRATSDEKPKGAAETDTVTFSAGSASLRATQVIVEQVLAKIGSATTGAEDLFISHGKTEFDASIAGATDQSPDAVSQRIFDGVTGYIYGAFVNSHPDMTAEDFDTFKSQVLKGVEQGLSEARDILTGLSALSPEIDDTIGSTIDALYGKLDSWFAEMEEHFAEEAPAEASTEEAPVEE